MPRRILEGNVVSNKTDKTVTVLVERRYMHPVYKKYIKKSDKFTAHDEQNLCKEGDRVQIIECRPISKTKRWAVLRDGVASMPVVSTPAQKAEAAKKAPAAKKAAAPKAEKAPKAAKAAKAEKPAAEKKPAAKKTTKATKKDA